MVTALDKRADATYKGSFLSQYDRFMTRQTSFSWRTSTYVLRLAMASSAIILFIGVAYPILWLLLRSVGLPSGGFTVAHWSAAFRSPFLAPAARNTLLISITASSIAAFLGAGLAFLVAKSDLPGKTFLRWTVLSPFLISQSVMAVAWILLGERQGGLLNVWFNWMGLPFSVEILSTAGIVFTTVLLILPLCFSTLEGMAGNLNTELEDVAFLSKASRTATLVKIVIPLLMPGIAAAWLLCFMLSNVMFSVQGILGLPSNVWTVANLIFFTLNTYPIDTGSAIVLAICLLALGAALLILEERVLAGSDYQTIIGRYREPRPWPLPRWVKALALTFMAALFIGMVALPYGALLFRSLASHTTQVDAPLRDLWSTSGFDSYRRVLSDPAMLRGLRNSAVLALSAAFFCVVIAFIVGHFISRSRRLTRRIFQALCVVPFAFSGMVLGIAFILAFSSGPLALHGTFGILLLAYTVRELALAFKVLHAAMAQVHTDIEDAALLCGASELYMLRKILWPLLAPSLLGISLLIFLAAFREIESSVLLAGPGKEVFGYNIFIGFQNGTWNEISAISLIGVALCASVTLAVGAVRRWAFGARMAESRQEPKETLA